MSDLTPFLRKFRDFNLGVFAPALLHRQSREIVDPSPDAKALFAVIREFTPVEGWLWGDAHPVQLLQAGGTLKEEGRIFCAEFVDSKMRSAKIRHIDGDRWVWSIMSEGQGEPLHVEEIKRISTYFERDVNKNRHPASFLRYRRYWRVMAGETSSVVAARFVGFEAGQ